MNHWCCGATYNIINQEQYVVLQIHFRQEHHLCEDESCLSKKFVVFPSEAEMKVINCLIYLAKKAPRNKCCNL